MGFVANREIKLFRRVPGPGCEIISEHVFLFMQFSRFLKTEPSFATKSVILNRTELSIGGICSKSRDLTF